MTQKFIYSILYCVIFSGYHRHIDNCTREMSKLLLDQIKKIIHVKKSQGKYGSRLENTGSAQTFGAILCIW